MGIAAAVKAPVPVSRSASPETIKALSEIIRVAARQLGTKPSDPIEIMMCRSFDDEDLRDRATSRLNTKS